MMTERYRTFDVRHGSALFTVTHNSENGHFVVLGPDGRVFGPYHALFRHVDKTVKAIHDQYLEEEVQKF